MKIKMLNEATIGKIAAGEVIIRPVSVIKELVENAIDAGASRISVAIENGGKTKMSVLDNGCGIAYNEVSLAFERHATSKLLEIEDLQTIETLGFRGEALASIMAVSKVMIKTRFSEEETGSQTIFEGGRLINQRVCSHDCGTLIEVSDLFYNMPVRQKHMGKSGAEAGLIRDMVEKIALSHPEIAFTFYSDRKKQFTTIGNGQLQDAIEGIYGRGFFKNLIELNTENAPMKLTGYIGNLSAGRSVRDFQIFFINGRYVKNPALSRAFEEAYEGYMMQHKHPVGIVFMELPGKMLDVNIHPAKTEVAVLNQSLVMILFKQGIRQTLRNSDLSIKLGSDPTEKAALPEENKQNIRQLSFNVINKETDDRITVEKEASDSGIAEITVDRFDKNQILSDISKQNDSTSVILDQSDAVETGIFERVSDGKNHYSVDPVKNSSEIKKQLPEENGLLSEKKTKTEDKTDSKKIDFSYGKIIGQIFSTYILLEMENEVWLIDQHAAHEAFMYEELRRRFELKEDFPAQTLLVPVPISVEPRVVQAFDEWKSEFLSYGFDCDVFGEDAVMVRSVPIILGEPQEASLICAFIDTRFYQAKPDKDFQIKKIISMSCKAAVKGNQTLSTDEIKILLDKLSGLNNPFTCPHGRPIIFKLREYDLQKLFKRVV